MARLALLLAAALAAGSLAGCGADDERDVVAVWFDETAAAVEAQQVPDPVASRTWALAWWAADRAADAARGAGRDPDPAIATAVHDVLVALVPAHRDRLDDLLDEPDTDGAREAAAVLAERVGDGLTVAEVNRPYVLPPPSPGTYRSTGAPPQQAGQGDARPFLLLANDEVETAPPPPVDSAAYRAELDEVRLLGVREGSQRTTEQTALAVLWGPSLVPLLTPAVRAAVVDLPPREAASLLSDLHRTLLDAQLAGYRAKYEFLRWRPETAIGDGWRPLLDTPPQPDHPSGHTVYAAALAAVLEDRVGDRPFRVGDRTYDRWQQVVQENVDARVWAGVHVRSADVAGADLGRRVAERVRPRLAG